MKTISPGVIPAGLTLRGAIEGAGDLVVAGRIEGTIELEGSLRLEAGGTLTADVRVQRAVIGGSVEGNLKASESVELLGEARIEGDLRAPRLIIAEGAMVRGRVELGGGHAADEVPVRAGAVAAVEAGPASVGAAGEGVAAAPQGQPDDLPAQPRDLAFDAPDPRGKPPLPPSALTFGDRRKRIVPSQER